MRPQERGVPTPQQVERTQDVASGETALLGDFEDVESLPDAADLEVRAPREPQAAVSHSVRVAWAKANSGMPRRVKMSTASRAWGRASAALP